MRFAATIDRRPFVLTRLVMAALALTAGPRIVRAADPVRHDYDVADLLTPVRDFTDAPSLGMAEPGSHPGPVDARPAEKATAERGGKELAAWLTSALRGGDADPPATVALEGKALIVTADDAAHALAARLLEKLRDGRRTRVSVEARHIAYGGGLGAIEDPAARELLTLAAAPDRPAVPLTEEQVDALLRAVQGARKTAVINAPRVTLFNHQRAYMLVANSRAYVAGHDEARAINGRLSFQPRLETVSAGLVLDARAAVGADGRSVALDVRYEHARLLEIAVQWRPASDGTPLAVQVPSTDQARTHRTLATADGETTLVYLGRAEPAPAAPPAFREKFGAGVEGDMFLLVKATVVKAQVGRAGGAKAQPFPPLTSRVEP